MKNYRTLTLSITLFAAILFASCEKTEVAPDIANKVSIGIDGIPGSLEIFETADVDNNALYLPYNTEYQLQINISSKDGIEHIWWDVPKYFFDINQANFASTEDFIGVNGPGLVRRVYSLDEWNLPENDIQAFWTLTTWPENIIIIHPQPKKDIHIQLETVEGEIIIFDIPVEFSNDQFGWLPKV